MKSVSSDSHIRLLPSKEIEPSHSGTRVKNALIALLVIATLASIGYQIYANTSLHDVDFKNWCDQDPSHPLFAALGIATSIALVALLYEGIEYGRAHFKRYYNGQIPPLSPAVGTPSPEAAEPMGPGHDLSLAPGEAEEAPPTLRISRKESWTGKEVAKVILIAVAIIGSLALIGYTLYSCEESRELFEEAFNTVGELFEHKNLIYTLFALECIPILASILIMVHEARTLYKMRERKIEIKDPTEKNELPPHFVFEYIQRK